MRRGSFLIVLVSITVGLLGGSVSAAELSADLASYLATVSADERIRVVIRVAGAVDGITLKRELASTYTRRADRHREALLTLQKAASRSQENILPVLNRMRLEDKAENIKTYWIDNLITAEMTAGAVEELVARDDIEKIYPYPTIKLIEPTGHGSLAKPGATRAEIGLRAIGADSMWAMGYTGKGTLIATIDTGVDGDHPALSTKWRGNNGYSRAESWFDPVEGDSIPHTFGTPGESRYMHGTMVAGILVGHDSDTGDTTGVAFDAQWISAGVLDVPGADIFEALQWLIDPDGDPNTEEDVPDVINNSWGYITLPDWAPLVDCDDLFWNVIDNLEAAGAVTIWAAGNEGYVGEQDTPQSIRNPANRITSEVNTFAVGMVSTQYYPDTLFFVANSSRGPSSCDGQTPKPEVVAPGYAIRSTTPEETYSDQDWWGTSFAVPHVAGAVALLREYNPNATVDTIKKVLLYTAFDLPPDGDDNYTGKGLINIPAALDLMPANSEPHLYIKSDSYVRPSPGERSEITVTVRNCGTPVTNVTLDLISLDNRLAVDTDVYFFGDFNLNEIKSNADAPFMISVNRDVRVGERLPVEWQFQGDGYSRTVRGAIAVGPSRDLDVFTHNIGNVIFTISSFGEYGLDSSGGNVWRKGTVGFYHPATSQEPTLFEMGFLVGTDPDHVSDAVRQIGDMPANDFLTDASGNLRVEQPGDLADQQTFAAFSDAYAENPLGLFIEQRTYAYADTTDDDYVILEYVIHNRSDSVLSGVRAALFADWDFPWADGTLDFVRFDSLAGVGWMRHKIEGLGLFRGIAALTPNGMISYRMVYNKGEIYDGFTEQEKWEYMTADFDSVSNRIWTDCSHIMTIGPLDLSPGDSATVAFAVIGAESRAEMIEFAHRARRKYQCTRGLVSELELDTEPEELIFTAETGGSLPQSQSLSIQNFCGDTTWELDYTALWLEVDPDSGLTPAVAEISITDIDFPAGDYFDTLIVTSPGAADTVRVPVTLQIVESLPWLRVDPVWIHFTSTQFEPPPDEKHVWVCNDGLSDLDWMATNDSAWLTVTPAGGLIGALDSTKMTVIVDTTGLVPGDHRDTIVVSGTDAVDSPQKVTVIFTMLSGATAASNQPNPFNPYKKETTIYLGVTQPSTVEVKIYDLAGELVRTLLSGWVAAGATVAWDGGADDGPVVADGVYLCHIKAATEDGTVREQIIKIAVLKE